MYLGKRLHEVGWANVMSRHPLHIANSDLPLIDFLSIYRRWMMFGHNGLPFSFTWPQWTQSAIFYLALTALVAALDGGSAGAIALPFILICTQLASLLALHRRNGGGPVPMRWWWAPFALILFAPLVVASAALRPRVTWRGRSYDLDHNAALATNR
jgi:hypothetical protein